MADHMLVLVLFLARHPDWRVIVSAHPDTPTEPNPVRNRPRDGSGGSRRRR